MTFTQIAQAQRLAREWKPKSWRNRAPLTQINIRWLQYAMVATSDRAQGNLQDVIDAG